MKLYASFVEHNQEQMNKHLKWLGDRDIPYQVLYDSDKIQLKFEGEARLCREVAGYIMNITFHSVHLSA